MYPASSPAATSGGAGGNLVSELRPFWSLVFFLDLHGRLEHVCQTPRGPGPPSFFAFTVLESALEKTHLRLGPICQVAKAAYRWCPYRAIHVLLRTLPKVPG